MTSEKPSVWHPRSPNQSFVPPVNSQSFPPFLLREPLFFGYFFGGGAREVPDFAPSHFRPAARFFPHAEPKAPPSSVASITAVRPLWSAICSCALAFKSLEGAAEARGRGGGRREAMARGDVTSKWTGGTKESGPDCKTHPLLGRPKT